MKAGREGGKQAVESSHGRCLSGDRESSSTAFLCNFFRRRGSDEVDISGVCKARVDGENVR
jgi:hypothetical protein